jgi:predicted TIM-barrel fold metal-dependent hydrolase
MAPLVDFHTHFFSRTLFEVLAASSPLKGTPEELLERAARSLGIDVPSGDPREHLERWLDELEQHGVSHVVSFASVPEEVDVLLEVAGQVPDRISIFAVVDPRQPSSIARVAGPLREGRLRGALFFPGLHGYRIDGPEAVPVLECLAEQNFPAVVHCGILRIPLRERLAIPRQLDLRAADPLHVVRAADRFHGVPFVIPSFGAGFFRETLMAGAQAPNVMVDTSSSNGWMATDPSRPSLADVFERALAVFGPERILFGTDSATFPRGWRRDVFLAQKEALGACGIRDEERARILGLNASRLLRIH